MVSIKERIIFRIKLLITYIFDTQRFKIVSHHHVMLLNLNDETSKDIESVVDLDATLILAKLLIHFPKELKLLIFDVKVVTSF